MVWEVLSRGFANCYPSFKTQVGKSHLPWEACPEMFSYSCHFQLRLTTSRGLFLQLRRKLYLVGVKLYSARVCLLVSYPSSVGRIEALWERELCFQIVIPSLFQRLNEWMNEWIIPLILAWKFKHVCNLSQSSSSALISLYPLHSPLERVKVKLIHDIVLRDCPVSQVYTCKPLKIVSQVAWKVKMEPG